MISTIEKVLFLKRVDLFRQIPGEDLAQGACQVLDRQSRDALSRGSIGGPLGRLHGDRGGRPNF